jgi:putative ABC transport system permease protein
MRINLVTIAYRMLRRQSHLPALRLLLAALVISAASVVSILSLTTFLNKALLSSSADFLAGDRQLVSPRDVPAAWLEKAAALNLKQSKAIELSSMLLAGEAMQLVSVKAVDDAYPLKGELQSFIYGEVTRAETSTRPPRLASSEVWMHQRLFPLLAVEKNGEVFLGDARFSATRVLEQEPDIGFQLSGIAPRVLLRLEDLAKANLLQAGSRAKWRYYFAGSEADLAVFDAWIKARINPSQQWQGIKEGRPAIASALDRAESYLLLGAGLTVCLAVLAIALCARQYAQAQLQTVGVMKTLGMRGNQIFSLFFMQVLMLSALALLLGVIVGYLVSYLLAVALIQFMPELPAASGILAVAMKPSIYAVITLLVATMGFALPLLGGLRRVSPMVVLRPDGQALAKQSPFFMVGALGAVACLLRLYIGSWPLVGLFAVACVALLVILFVASIAFYKLIQRWLLPKLALGSAARFGFGRLITQTKQTFLLTSVYAFAICLFALIFLTRTSLISDWQSQLPDDAPNHFLINVAPEQVAPLQEDLEGFDKSPQALYPMVRGRLSHINGDDVKVAVTKDVAALNRELNLSWAAELPSDNEIVDGQWWVENENPTLRNDQSALEVSVEQELADNIGIELDDVLGFTIGARFVEATVVSIRTVQWDSMRPNFYVFFRQGDLADFAETYITSFHLPNADKAKLNVLARNYPSVSIIELDQIVKKVRAIVSQVSRMLELVLSFVLIAALLVVASLTNASMSQRIKEAVIARVIGSTSRFLGRSYFYEFSCLGFVAGGMAVLCAEFALNLMQGVVFAGVSGFHFELWLYFPIASAALVGGLGVWQVRHIARTPPMLVLRNQAS